MPTSHTYFSQRLKLHYLDWGNAGAAPVLLVHGVQDHAHNWDWVAEELADDFHVLAPDLRGHGDSEWAEGGSYSKLDFAYDLLQLVDQENLAPVHVISHSMGGTIGCLFTGAFPGKVRSLICIEGVGGYPNYLSQDGDPGPRIHDWVTNIRRLAGRVPRRYPNLTDAFTRMQQANPHLSEARARHLTIHGSNQNEDGTYSWKFDNYTHANSPFDINFSDMTSLWENIVCPVLIVNADNGYPHRIGQEGTLRHFPEVTLKIVEDAGHWVHHDQFETLIELTRNFLATQRVTTR